MRKIALAIALLAVCAATAVAASGRDTLVRHRISWSQKSGNRMTGASVNFFVPKAWQTLRAKDKRHLSFREGSAGCRYSVTFTMRLAADTAQTPAEHVAKAIPAAGPRYVLDYGQRGAAAAWRVVRRPSPAGGPTRLSAMRADHRSTGNGMHMWQETVVSAASRKGDVCHSGTYRDVLAPQIGDALATASGRAYDFATHR